MNNFNEKHKLNLLKSYQEVGQLIDERKDFLKEELESSRLLFNKNSLENKKPIPIKVDVYAILSGISFDKKTTQKITSIINSIREILEGEDFYFVKSKNLGIEFAILKWPTDEVNHKLIKETESFLNKIKIPEFNLNILGIQSHTDGCIILKGVDHGREIFNLRKELKKKLHNLPIKQSNWAHIPLGRILSPIGKEKMVALKDKIHKLNLELNFNILIDKVHLVHETQWYMEDKRYILTKKLT